jgi:PKD repeat protein
MKKIVYVFLFLFLSNSSLKACNAFFTHTFACAGDTVFFYAVDQAAVYTWDFGDTVSGVANVSHDTDSYHVYNSPGTYYVTLFVNIGAEWDYKTQIIHVGTDCFNAAFSASCSGDTTLVFTNESTGNYSVSAWDFGDSVSGVNNTSSVQNPSHTFSGPGNYNVMLIVSDGVLTDTVTQTVTVDTSCLSVTFYNFLGGDCFQDTTTIVAYYTGNPISYTWDFGDTASGSNNTSTDSIGKHLFTAMGTYLVTLIVSDGIQTDTFYNVQNIIDCNVWPGNINTDGTVDMEDLFAIGIYYGDSGTVRPSASNNWTGQSCPDWNSTGWSYMYLQELLDKKHADCNGDGKIDSLDINVISQNYGLHNPNYYQNDLIQMMPYAANDAVLEVSTPGTFYGPSNVNVDVSLPINLSAIDSVNAVYGLSARIYYDQSIVPGSVSIDFNNSQLGTQGLDFVGLYKDFYSSGYIDFGMVRTNKSSRTVSGAVAFLNFSVYNFNGIMNFSFDPVIRLIRNGWSQNQEIFIPVSSLNSQLNVILSSVDETVNNPFSVYPNPVNDYLNIHTADGSKIKQIILTDLAGRIVKEEIFRDKNDYEKITCNELARGLYFLTLYTTSGKYTDKVEIVK